MAPPMIRRFATAVLLVMGVLILMAEVEDQDARREELAQKNEVYNWRSK
jgi:hypothetical protein